MRPPLAGAINQGRIARDKTSTKTDTYQMVVVLLLFQIWLLDENATYDIYKDICYLCVVFVP